MLHTIQKNGLLASLPPHELGLLAFGMKEAEFQSGVTLQEAGEAIATVGDTGGRSPPGLYLEIRRGAKAVDPVPWFRRPSP